MKADRGAGLVGLLAVLGLVLTGCGGSSSSSDRSKYVSQIRASLQQSSSSLSSPELANCVSGQAKGLPTDQLKTVANSPNSPAGQKIAFKLASPCVAKGYGASALRAQVLSTIENSTSLSSLPSSYTTCVTGKAKTITNAQLASFLQAGEQGVGAIHAAGEKLGRQYGEQCLGDPAVLSSMRALFVKPIRTEVARYSPAFGKCVLAQAEALPDQTLRGLISHPATASAQSEKLGKSWAQRCVSQGIRP